MIYIAIDHINGELQEVIEKYTTKEQTAKELYNLGYIIIEIDIENNRVEEWRND